MMLLCCKLFSSFGPISAILRQRHEDAAEKLQFLIESASPPKSRWGRSQAVRPTSAAAFCAGPGHWGLKGSLFLTAPILPTFAASFVHCIKMLLVPCSVLCGTRTKGLSAIALQLFSTWLMAPTNTRYSANRVSLQSMCLSTGPLALLTCKIMCSMHVLCVLLLIQTDLLAF